jgi:hypothetical protein
MHVQTMIYSKLIALGMTLFMMGIWPFIAWRRYLDQLKKKEIWAPHVNYYKGSVSLSSRLDQYFSSMGKVDGLHKKIINIKYWLTVPVRLLHQQKLPSSQVQKKKKNMDRTP